MLPAVEHHEEWAFYSHRGHSAPPHHSVGWDRDRILWDLTSPTAKFHSSICLRQGSIHVWKYSQEPSNVWVMVLCSKTRTPLCLAEPPEQDQSRLLCTFHSHPTVCYGLPDPVHTKEYVSVILYRSIIKSCLSIYNLLGG